ncbi:MAG: hypothetical protein AAGD01_17200 [Acidobacteriota bacterium]
MKSLYVLCVTLCLLCLGFANTLSAQQTSISIKALDPHGKVQDGIRFSFSGVQSLPTDNTGVTTLEVPPLASGRSLEMDLPADLSEEWVLINDSVHVPAGLAEGPVEVAVMRRSDLRLLAGEARDEAVRSGRTGEVDGEADRRQILIEVAADYGLNEDQLASAIEAFGETKDPMDQGIAAYLSGEYDQARASLTLAAEAQEADLVVTLRYLGATQYAQGD